MWHKYRSKKVTSVFRFLTVFSLDEGLATFSDVLSAERFLDLAESFLDSADANVVADF